MGILLSALRSLDRTGIDPVAWHPPTPPPLTGPFARSTELDGAERWAMPGSKGPEDVAVDHQGRLVTGTDDGKVWRFDEAGRASLIADTGGRPLGVEILDDGRYLICDCERGVLRVDEAGRIETLTDTALGRPLLACNNSAVGRDGTIYFTDSSAKFSVAEHRTDVLEHGGTGRLIRFDPATGETDLLADGLQFANGVGLAADESFVVVAETGAYQIRRVELAGPDTGRVSIWAENLPGLPDNVTSQTPGGVFWVALYSPRMRLLDLLAPHPALRVVAANLPQWAQPEPDQRGWVLGLDASGAVVHSLQGGADSYAPITGVREADGWLYLGSLTADTVARVPAPPSAM
ncbi:MULTISPECIES: SMP-30/gluconolactonase/LRE family protein [Rhodococcus]|uniref:SMP-30/gluconolactonase/LRE family protein n=1 Tax=Rhodococcus TaxID=1827 RepID=UPI000BE3517D|nr:MULTISPECIES: SMP-30/gluconolactonase/LRE family protein [Rhodococcus]MBP1159005.1 strictosidine synthase [Rhodococcus sp. PvR099]MCZ4558875.1 SMP-30/gluconolactonase/LRE family protein [Rhodococcus maanshanensis]